MIIAFDGNVYTGKTTLIATLAKKMDANIVKEYSAYFDETTEERENGDNHLKIQHKYFTLDQKRKFSLSSKKINLLDRSFISLFAHVWALYNCGIDIRKEVLGWFSFLLNKNEIIIPAVYIYVHCPFDLVKRRFLYNEKYGIPKNTADYLIEQKYFNSVRTFNKRVSKFLPSLCINTTFPLSKNITEITRFISNQSELQITTQNLLTKITSALLMEK